VLETHAPLVLLFYPLPAVVTYPEIRLTVLVRNEFAIELDLKTMLSIGEPRKEGNDESGTWMGLDCSFIAAPTIALKAAKKWNSTFNDFTISLDVSVGNEYYGILRAPYKHGHRKTMPIDAAAGCDVPHIDAGTAHPLTGGRIRDEPHWPPNEFVNRDHANKVETAEQLANLEPTEGLSRRSEEEPTNDAWIQSVICSPPQHSSLTAMVDDTPTANEEQSLQAGPKISVILLTSVGYVYLENPLALGIDYQCATARVAFFWGDGQYIIEKQATRQGALLFCMSPVFTSPCPVAIYVIADDMLCGPPLEYVIVPWGAKLVVVG